ncbi:MAG: hypothetical protein D6798_21235 [Deltaproteobacteria bacterium]|nr:MAG: hypothetical protein D6798_21235 [Deltaproteobacteria bacterium]
MGVGDRQRPDRLLGGAWLAATLLTAASADILPLAASLAVLGAAAVGSRWPLAGPVLAVIAAPLWLQAAGVSGSLQAPTSPAGIVGASVLGVALVLAVAPRPGRTLRGVVLGLGLVQALRMWLVQDEVPGAPPLAGPLFVATVLVAGAAAVPARRRRRAAAVLACAALVHLGRGGWRMGSVPESSEDVRRLARTGGLARHLDRLVARPALGLAAVAADPLAPRPALDLLPVVGPQRLVDVGWRPGSAPLDPADRCALARALERRGRGGEALRLLRRDGNAPEVAWTRVLLARVQGLPQADDDWGTAPPGTPHLPGAVRLSWSLLANGARQLDFHLDRDVPALYLDVRGQAHRGPPRLWVTVDAGEPRRITPGPTVSTVAIAGPLAAGPHRLRVVFDNDLADADGDRNAWVDAVRAP